MCGSAGGLALRGGESEDAFEGRRSRGRGRRRIEFCVRVADKEGMQDSPRHFQLPSDNQIRLFLVFLAGVAVALYLGVRIGGGDLKWVMGFFVAVAVAGVMVALGPRGWLVLPLAMNLDVKVPVTFGRDFSAGELSSMLLIAHTVIQVALRRQKFEIFRKRHLWVMLYGGWAFMVFILNPTGLLIFGSEVVGGRFYFQIFLAMTNFLIVANAAIEERDAKMFFILLFAATCATTVVAAITGELAGEDLLSQIQGGETPYYTWHQALAGPAGVILKFLFSYYTLEALLSIRGTRWWPVILFAYALALVSGKRMGVAGSLAVPFFAALGRRRWGLGLLLSGLVLGGALFLAVGQGRWFDLPLAAQRSISYLPGDWHPSAALGVTDEYRKILREDAIRQILEHPIIGKGFAFSTSEYWADLVMTRGQIITGIRAGGSWHTTWLGVAADFGIPAAFIWFMVLLSFTLLAYRSIPQLPEGTFRKALAIYLLITICGKWMSSWTSGHSALDPFGYLWQYAMLLPLARAAADSQSRQGTGPREGPSATAGAVEQRSTQEFRRG